MLRKLLFIFLLVACTQCYANGFDQDSVKSLIRKYEELLSVYGNSGCKSIGSKANNSKEEDCVALRNEMIPLFFGNGSEVHHSNDLFNFEGSYGLIEYLRDFEKYSNQVIISFSDSIIVEDSLSKDQFAIASVLKRLECGGIP